MASPSGVRSPHTRTLVSALKAILAAGLALWIIVVLAAYYPRPIQALAHRLGLATAPWLPPLAGVTLPPEWGVGRLGEALWAILCVVFLGWTSTALGWRLMRAGRMNTTGDAQDLLFSCALGLGATAYAVFLLGLGLLTPAALALLAAALGLHAVLWTWQGPWRPAGDRGARAGGFGPLRAIWRDCTAAIATLRRRPTLGITALLLGLFGLTALLVALGPEVEFDALWYHLFLPRQHLATGRLVDIPEEWVSLYPQTIELLFGLGLGWGGVIAAKLVHYLFGLLAAGATYLVARHWLPARWALVAALLFISTPTVHWELTTAHIDLAVAFFVTLSLLDLVHWWDGGDDRRVVRSALMLGLALASKHSALLLLPAACLIVLAGLFVEGRRGDATTGGSGTSPLGSRLRALLHRRRLLLLPAFPALALTLASPWYLRSWLHTGNPVFPMLYPIFGGPADRWSPANEREFAILAAGFGVGRDPTTLITLPWHLTVAPDQFAGSLGPIFLIALPLMGLALFVSRSTSLWLLALWTLSYGVLWASPVGFFQLRFLLSIVPMLAVLAALGLRLLARQLRAIGRPRLAAGVLPLGLLMTALNLPFFIPWHGAAPGASTLYDGIDLGAVVDRQAAAAYTTRLVPAYGAAQFANTYLPPTARILTFEEGFHFYSDRPLLLWHAAMARPATVARPWGDERQVLAALQEMNITHVLMPRNRDKLRQLQIVLAEDGFLQQHLVPVYHDDGIVIYEVARG